MNVNDKISGSTYSAAEWTEFKNEVQNAIIASGQSLTSNSIQLKQAIARYVANAASYTDSGIADAYSLEGIGLNDTITTYLDGTVVTFKAGNANTGSSTAAISGLAAKTIKKEGFTLDLEADDIVAGKVYTLFYSLADDAFEIAIGGGSGGGGGFGGNENLQSGNYSLLVTDYGSDNDFTIAYTGSGGNTFTHLTSASLTAQDYVFIEHRGTGVLEVDFANVADRLGAVTLGRDNIFLSPGEKFRFVLTGTSNVWNAS